MEFIRKFTTRILNSCVRKCSPLTKLLFGVNVVSSKRIHWDFTTLLFRKVLKEQIKPGYKVLEIGTGPHAILSIYMAKKAKCDITSTEINSDYIKEAMRTAKINKVKIRVVQSDLFQNIDGKYNIIFWNSVYIPRKIGITYGIEKFCDYYTDWCGGEKGFENIALFLEFSSGYLDNNGKILLGFNNMYLKEESVIKLCERYGYNIEKICHRFLNPSRVAICDRCG